MNNRLCRMLLNNLLHLPKLPNLLYYKVELFDNHYFLLKNSRQFHMLLNKLLHYSNHSNFPHYI
jgi:hypothetical protein